MQLLLVVALHLCRDTALLQQAWAIPQEAVDGGSISVMGAFCIGGQGVGASTCFVDDAAMEGQCQ